jgi:hypothetical protein
LRPCVVIRVTLMAEKRLFQDQNEVINFKQNINTIIPLIKCKDYWFTVFLAQILKIEKRVIRIMTGFKDSRIQGFECIA